MSSDCIKFDVMYRGRFICEMKMPCYMADGIANGRLSFSDATIARFVESKLPTLKGKDYKIFF